MMFCLHTPCEVIQKKELRSSLGCSEITTSPLTANKTVIKKKEKKKKIEKIEIIAVEAANL